MDNVDIAGVLHLPVDTVKRVRTQLNNNDEAFGRAVQEYLEYKSGPFRDSKAGVDDWAESGKPRRAKKVRFSPAPRAQSATERPAPRAPACARSFSALHPLMRLLARHLTRTRPVCCHRARTTRRAPRRTTPEADAPTPPEVEARAVSTARQAPLRPPLLPMQPSACFVVCFPRRNRPARAPCACGMGGPAGAPGAGLAWASDSIGTHASAWLMSPMGPCLARP